MEKEVMKATHVHDKRMLPCGSCLYLLNGKVCPFQNCIRLDGWVAKGEQKKEKSR